MGMNVLSGSTGYYGKINLDEGKYYILCMVKDFKGYSMVPETKEWKPSELAMDAPMDQTHYDELSEEDARKLAEEWGVSKEDFEKIL